MIPACLLSPPWVGACQVSLLLLGVEYLRSGSGILEDLHRFDREWKSSDGRRQALGSGGGPGHSGDGGHSDAIPPCDLLMALTISFIHSV